MRRSIAAALLSTVAAASGAGADGLTYRRDLALEVGSSYVFRGVQQAEETFRLNGELRFNGLHGGVTFLQPFNGDDFADEARLYGGWSPHVEDRGSPIDVEFGFTYYMTPDGSPGFPDAARFEPYGAIFLDAPLMPSLYGFYDAERETFTLEGRATHFVELTSLNGLELKLDAGHVSPDAAMDHSYAQGSIDFVRNFLNGMEGYVGVHGAVSSEETFFDDVTAFGPVYDDDRKVWIAAGFTATF